MKFLYIFIAFSLVLLTTCIKIEEEPIMTVKPSAEISAHVKNQQVFATAQINVNPLILFAGNIPIYYEYTGELAIYNTETGTVIDVNAFTGGGLSQYYTVSADTTSHDRFIIIAEGSVDAITNIGNDDDTSNDKLVASGAFHNEKMIIISELNSPTGD
ncbi:MAG: hypothetical protein KAT15_06430 [Bacteroidales bacterium]|nr:hypothetical protein [Bacteroidales bacterium]